MIGRITLFFSLILALSCETQDEAKVLHPLERLADDKAGDVVRKAIEFAGGWNVWDSKKDFSFYKIISAIDSSGNVIKKTKQLHEYKMGQRFKGRLTWKVGEDDFVIVNNGEEAVKYRNGLALTDEGSRNEAWNSSFGSNYVISMPFKLTDPGAILSYEGVDSITLGRPVHALKVEYEKGAGSTGGMHKWWYYFDLDSYDLAGNFLDYGTGYSLTTYETFANVAGLRVHLRRHSYSSNINKEKIRLRTIYENEEMTFDKQLKPSTFELL